MTDKLKSALEQDLIKLEKEYFSLRMMHSSKQLKETHKLKLIKRDIARLKTKMRLQVS